MRRALVISYHLQPDPAVGGLRPASFVKTLCRAGWEVVVIAHRVPGMADFWKKECGSNVIVCEIPETPRISDGLVSLAKAARTTLWRRKPRVGDKGANPASVATPSADAAPPDLSSETMLERLERWFHASCSFVDRHKLWSTRVFFAGLKLRRSESFELIVSSGPPMTPHVAAVLLARVGRSDLVLDLRDPWLNLSRRDWATRARFLDRLNMQIFRYCVRRAAAIVTASPGIARFVTQSNCDIRGPVKVILNGFEDTSNALSGHVQGKLHLLYAGTLYWTRNPFPLLETVDRLLESGEMDEHRVAITFAGDCRSWNGTDIPEWARGRRVDAVLRISDAIPHEQMPSLIASANVVVNFAYGQPAQIPAKTFEYVGAGKEMLALTEADSDTARVVREAAAGTCVDPTNAKDMSKVLSDLYRRYVTERGTYVPDAEKRTKFSRASQNAVLLDLLDSLAASRGQRT